MSVETHFRKLKGLVENFEIRPGQLMMAKGVERALSEGEVVDGLCHSLVVEAETGVGKTLAYLVPAIDSARRVVVSTATLNLQDQIIHKEIPLISKLMGRKIKVVCVKGRQNYLCHFRWNQYRYGPQQQLFTDEYVEKIDEWLQKTETGDRAELDWLPDGASLWPKISAQSHQCLGGECPDAAFCFVSQMRKEAARAEIIITNHHLLFSDLTLKKEGFGEVLPRYEAVVFDEAHHIESIATTYFGSSISKYQLYDLFSDITLLSGDELAYDVRTGLLSDLKGLEKRIDRFFEFLPDQKGRYPLLELLEELGEQWMTEVENVRLGLQYLGEKLSDMSSHGEIWNLFAERTARLENRFVEITARETAKDEGIVVRWYEKTQRNHILSVTPIDVTEELEQNLYRRVDVCIFTSATLRTGGDFGYFLKRAGIAENSEQLRIGSPFDYEKRVKIYVPNTGFPEPASRNFAESFCKETEELISLCKGRTLVLCTSFRSMETTAEFLRERSEYDILVQGTRPRAALLNEFRENVSSILLGVASFWEGVDVPGDSLGCVIIDKLPFEVPTDPVFKARVEAVKRNGGNPFFEYQIPAAVLSLRQGVGRLMRSSLDKGIIAVMDVRLFTKGYGKCFLRSLPPSPVVRELCEVERFLGMVE